MRNNYNTAVVQTDFDEVIYEFDSNDAERFCLACSDPLYKTSMLVCFECLEVECDEYEKAVLHSYG